MFWTVVDRLAKLTFLCVHIVLIALLITNSNEAASTTNFDAKIEVFTSEVRKVMDSNIQYLEGRVNKVQEQQDNYMNTSMSRMDVLEQRMLRLEKDRKTGSRIINYNNSSAIINGEEQKTDNKEF